MLVPVVLVGRVVMAIVHVVHVVTVSNGVVPAAVTVLVGMVAMDDVGFELALVPVILVLTMHMAVVQVVGVAAVLDRHVTAARPVDVVVTGMDLVGGGAHQRLLRRGRTPAVRYPDPNAPYQESHIPYVLSSPPDSL